VFVSWEKQTWALSNLLLAYGHAHAYDGHGTRRACAASQAWVQDTVVQ
jgi:hypothetical protein